MNRFICFILFCLVLSNALSAQESTIVDEALEFIAEETEGEFDYDTFQELLLDYSKKKINMNLVEREELEEFGLLSSRQIDELLQYREKIGSLVNIYELQAIPTFDLRTIYRILPFVDVKGDLDDFNFKGLFKKGQHQWFLRYQQVLEEQEGYIANDSTADGSLAPAYEGSPYKLYTRYRYSYDRNFSIGFTAEKDAGESFFAKSNPNGFDFYSAHMSIRNWGIFKHLTVGDFEVRLGQGLIGWTGLGFAKSADVMNIKKKAYPLKPYTSVNEFNFFRGAGATIDLGDFELTLFGSHKKTDSTVDTSEYFNFSEPGLVASSFYLSGFHRTENEVTKKRQLTQTNAGGTLQFEKSNFSVGANVMYTGLNVPFTRDNALYNQFLFSGDQQINASLDYHWVYRNIHLFGETAWGDNQSWATVNGAMLSVHSTLDLSLLYRNIGATYNALFSDAFTESSSTTNEKGVYMGLQFMPSRPWKISAYSDVFRFPWLRFGVDAPSNGSEQLLQINYKPKRTFELYLRYRVENKEQNYRGNEGPSDFLTNHRRTQLRFQMRYKLNKSLTLKSRAEKVSYQQGEGDREFGYVLFQDLTYKPLSSPISITARYALFEAESFQSRVYTYENDVLYAFSIPFFQDTGTRAYGILRYRLNRNTDIWFRYARTHYRDRDEISSGNERIVGNKRSEIKAQIRLRF